MANLVNPGNGGIVAQRNPLFSDIFGWEPFSNSYANYSRSQGVDVTKTEAGYCVELPVAGFKPEQIQVTLEDNVLTLAGQSEKRSFTRSLLVPDEIDQENISAKVEHGMLTLTLSLQPKAQPKKINVQVAN